MYAAPTSMAQGMGGPPQPQQMMPPQYPQRMRSSEGQNLAAELASLREQLEHEQSETNTSLSEYTKRIESVAQENKRLQMKLMRSQLRDSAKDSEVAVVKKEVLEKTAAIEQVMRDLQQRQQATLARVTNVATAMVTACQAPPRERTDGPGSPSLGQVGRSVLEGIANIHSTGGLALPEASASAVQADLLTGFGGAFANGRAPSAASSPPRARREREAASTGRFGRASPGPGSIAASLVERGSPGNDADEHRWFQSVKANLEHFGDVEVFFDNAERDCSACLEAMGTPYGIRPHKCNHVFHIECLLQWWTEGTCPVCSSSFAPDPDRLGRPGGSPSPPRSAMSPGGAAAAVRSGGGGRSLLTRSAGAPGPGTFGGPENAMGFHRARA